MPLLPPDSIEVPKRVGPTAPGEDPSRWASGRGDPSGRRKLEQVLQFTSRRELAQVVIEDTLCRFT